MPVFYCPLFSAKDKIPENYSSGPDQAPAAEQFRFMNAPRRATRPLPLPVRKGAAVYARCGKITFCGRDWLFWLVGRLSWGQQ